MTVAALFVERDGVYYGLPGVDPWDEERDARLYAGPHPVVAHPPCERWGRWSGNTGQDDGCFETAFHAVLNFGGVIEHPADSKAWRWFDMAEPPFGGGWIFDPVHGGWTCRVEQGHFGHRARKATWLYAAHVDLPALPWGKSVAAIGPRPGRDPVRERRIGAVQRMCRKERRATPIPFRDLLLGIARSARTARGAA